FVGLARVQWAPVQDPVMDAAARRVQSGAARTLSTLREWRNWSYLAFTASIIATHHLFWLLLPITALAVAGLTRRKAWHRWVGGSLLAFTFVRIGAAGSLSPSALHDPLFWGLIAAAAVCVSATTGRWPRVAGAASVLAGSAGIVATLLPVFPDFATNFPDLTVSTMRQSLNALGSQLGIVGAVALLGMWAQAVAAGGVRLSAGGRLDTGVRGALVAALLLVLAGAAPHEAIGPSWIVALGALIGLVDASGRQRKQGNPSSPNSPVGVRLVSTSTRPRLPGSST
ncbi:MAG: hypothetical protein HY655_12480, partial [Acidobacteria bacterium]|nr:hypothetical protein [Acidobacteriota bacterium]